ncbi:MAG: Protein of unknown function (DUF2478) [Roseibaca calidilacus]|uniref:3-dehydroquinate dehydratase n=1 Tax=Roseibaca calidilacus TaxID=1666912 RepID=A0A0P7YR94_9RHOB|nr:DUF2478 domain-containing protein [Roseibaca calidilacus]KPP92826.1 MAG: Protein of unknown function (DUF2478) [Roseibaca calidilacus]CUX80102.1 Protein of unknown function (DUF2478) [Roseibaca calidilacus]
MFAFFTAPGRGAGDALLAEVADMLTARGVRVRGVVQCNFEYDPARRCHMDLRILGSDHLVRISQERGIHAKGCRLDTQGLAEAVFHVDSGLAAGETDLVIVNKFGKQECDGEGFRDVIARALLEDIPVLTSCGPGHRAGLLEFSGGLATELPADAAQIVDWCVEQAALARQP